MIRFHDTSRPHVDCDHEGFAELRRRVSHPDLASARTFLGTQGIPFGVPVYVNDCPDPFYDMLCKDWKFIMDEGDET